MLLSESSDPFFCSECYACRQAEEISALQDELAMLKNEVCKLKKALQEATKSFTMQEEPVTAKESQLHSYLAAINNCPGGQGHAQTNIPHDSNSGGWTTFRRRGWHTHNRRTSGKPSKGDRRSLAMVVILCCLRAPSMEDPGGGCSPSPCPRPVHETMWSLKN